MAINVLIFSLIHLFLWGILGYKKECDIFILVKRIYIEIIKWQEKNYQLMTWRRKVDKIVFGGRRECFFYNLMRWRREKIVYEKKRKLLMEFFCKMKSRISKLSKSCRLNPAYFLTFAHKFVCMLLNSAEGFRDLRRDHRTRISCGSKILYL